MNCNCCKIGIDLGGSFIKFGRFDEGGRLLQKWEIPTTKTNQGSTILQDVGTAILNNLEENQLTQKGLLGIGIGVPGFIDAEGIVIHAPNLGWNMLDVEKELRKYIQVPIYIQNDANVAALGEQAAGSGKDCESMVIITLGTGVGSGIIVRGSLVSGHNGGAGELGHLPMNDQEEETCGCGKKGCLEQYASASGIVRVAKKMIRSGNLPSLMRDIEDLTAKDVFDSVKKEDRLAMEVAEVFGKALGKALAITACAIDPELFVIGGGVSKAGGILLDYIEKYYREYASVPSRHTKICLASLGNDAGIYGAACLVPVG